MKLKRISLLTLLLGVLLAVIGAAVPFITLQNYTSQNGAVGIIGGADTPTYELILLRIMNGWQFVAILFGFAMIISALFCLLFSKTVKNNCNMQTSALSLGLSAAGAAGIVCFFIWFAIASFGEASKHPIEYPVSILLGLLCFSVFVAFIFLYCRARMSNRSVKGFFIDVFTSVLYLPAFFFAFSYLYDALC